MTEVIDERGFIPDKFYVRRTDGSSGPGGEHANCQYFVLDLDHDENSVAALEAYARSCVKTRPNLARDLVLRCDELRKVHAHRLPEPIKFPRMGHDPADFEYLTRDSEWVTCTDEFEIYGGQLIIAAGTNEAGLHWDDGYAHYVASRGSTMYHGAYNLRKKSDAD